MPLDLPTLINEIEAAYQNAEDNPGTSNRTVAEAIGNAFDKYVKTATVSTVVTTPDTINGTGTGTLS